VAGEAAGAKNLDTRSGFQTTITHVPCRRRRRLRRQRMRWVSRRRCHCHTAFATVVTSSSSHRSCRNHELWGCPVQRSRNSNRFWVCPAQRSRGSNGFCALPRTCRRRRRLRRQRMRWVSRRRCRCPTAFGTVVTSSSSYRDCVDAQACVRIRIRVERRLL
jgi:hypothetical protein